jgi:dsDNA-specific endonuclease/ATPase MutS2
MSEKSDIEQNIHIPIDGTLDLHTFRPNEIGSLIPEYLMECRRKNIYHVRIIHGKGSGSLRRGVHGVLAKCRIVKSYSLADEKGGSWGATLVELTR